MSVTWVFLPARRRDLRAVLAAIAPCSPSSLCRPRAGDSADVAPPRVLPAACLSSEPVDRAPLRARIRRRPAPAPDPAPCRRRRRSRSSSSRPAGRSWRGSVGTRFGSSMTLAGASHAGAGSRRHHDVPTGARWSIRGEPRRIGTTRLRASWTSPRRPRRARGGDGPPHDGAIDVRLSHPVGASPSRQSPGSRDVVHGEHPRLSAHQPTCRLLTVVERIAVPHNDRSIGGAVAPRRWRAPRTCSPHSRRPSRRAVFVRASRRPSG